jgi:hypothetical protein
VEEPGSIQRPMLPVFAPPSRPALVGVTGRLLAAAVAVGCLVVLIIAAYLVPDPAGIGTEPRLGMPVCGFEQSTDLPCAGCGLTTSFNHAVRWQWHKAIWVQPLGAALALSTCVAVWVGGFVAATGRPIYRLLLPRGGGSDATIVVLIVGFGILAWGWKILARLTGIDGTDW